MNNVPIHELMQGALIEQYDANFQKVIDNIYDFNTPAKTPRQLTIVIDLKSDPKDREMVKISANTKLKLAPNEPIESKLILSYNAKTKTVSASEYSGQMKGQAMLDDEDEEEQPENVTNFNKAK